MAITVKLVTLQKVKKELSKNPTTPESMHLFVTV